MSVSRLRAGIAHFRTWQALQAVFIAVSFVAFLYQFYDPDWFLDRPKLLYPLIGGFSMLSLAKYGLLRRVEVKFLTGFVIWLLIITFWNYTALVYGYDRTLNQLLFAMLVCYPLALVEGPDTKGWLVRLVLIAYVAMITYLSARALLQVWQGTYVEGLTPGGYVLGLQANYDDRLALFMHPNYAGAVCALSLLLAIYLFLSSKKVAAKVLFALSGIITYVALAMSDSRTSMIAAAVAIGLLGFLVGRMALQKKRAWLGWVAGVACFLALTAGCYFLYGAVDDGMRSLRAGGMAVAEDTVFGEEEGAETPAAETGSADNGRSVLQDLQTINGRTYIWDAARDALRAEPQLLLRGALYEHSMAAVLPYLQSGLPFSHMHNSFLQTLVSVGLPGFLLLLAALCCFVRHSIRLFFYPGDQSLASRFLPSILVACVIIAMMEAMFFMTDQWLYNAVFFLVAGLVVCLSEAHFAKGAA